MSLTRKFLKSMQLTDEQIDSIIEAHTDTVDGLKEERDKFKADAEKLPGVQKALDEANENAKNSDTDGWKAKYDALKTEFDTFKNDQSAKELKAAKESAYRQLLKDAGISDKRLDSVLKVADLSTIELDKDGKVKNASDLTKSIKTEWSDFIGTSGKQGAESANPPSNVGSKTYTRDDIRKMSSAEINANWDNIKASLKNQ